MQLPKRVDRAAQAADELQRQLERSRKMRPQAGRPRTKASSQRPRIVVCGDSEAEIEAKLKKLREVVGPAKRGNKRVANQALIADLIDEFRNLSAMGITLPQQHNLSREACSYGLIDILKRHGKLPPSAGFKDLAGSSAKARGLRKKLGRSLSRTFTAVAKKA